ncbi:MAG: autotransporter-associated beta strand repeat-containing protein [Pirellulales bacterium]|nr:autotransporter-associated beta strand repeat-containing protein [Pirellulales bacterium]
MRGMLVALLAILAGAIAFSGAAQAVLIFDAVPDDGAAITDWNGNWYDDPTGVFDRSWNNGTGNVGWDSNNPDVAQFGLAPATDSFIIDVDYGGVAALGLTFNLPYTLQGGAITLTGDAPVISIPSTDTANILPNVYSPIVSSAATLEINGYGGSKYSLLTLYGANSYTGTLKLTGGGFVYIENTAGIPSTSAGIVVETGCTLAPTLTGVYDVPDLHISGYGTGQSAESLSANRGAIRFMQPVNEDDKYLTWNGNIILDSDAVISTYTNKSVTTLNGVISGDHQMIKTGLPELILTKPNTYTGGTRIYRGALTLNSTTGYAILGDVDYRRGYYSSTADYTKRLAMSHGDEDGMPQMEPTAVVYFDLDIGSQYLDLRGHTLTLGGISNPTTASNSRCAIQNYMADTAGTLIVDNANEFTYRGIIRDNGGTLALIKRGAATLTLDGRADQFTGGLSVEQGTLVYGANTERKSQASPSVVVKAGATLDVSAVSGYAISNAYTPEDPANPGTKLQQVLSGNGTIAGNLLVKTGGALAPGESVGQLTFNGALDLATDGLLTWDLGALSTASPGVDFDALLVNGNLTLGGTSRLALDFTAVGAPDAGVAFWTANHSWKIIDVESGATTGVFGSIVNGTFDAGDFTTTLDAGGDVLLNYIVGGVIVPPGDANRDGKVDAADAAALAANWLKATGAVWAEGDFNDDHAVDDLDLAILAANWGAGATTAAVPEPSTLALAVLALAGALALATRRRG